MQDARNLVLTGFMGTGKTTVGRQVARKLGMEFVDTDEMIESRHGPISQMFAERGEAEFREVERGIARELAAKTGLVIATGGRMLLDPANLDVLSANGRIFCLVATPEEIHERIVNDEARHDRPLLQVEDPQKRIVELLQERRDAYSQFTQIATGGAEPELIADRLAELWSSETT